MPNKKSRREQAQRKSNNTKRVAESRINIDDRARVSTTVTYERVAGRIMEELMFPFDDFSGVIFNELKRHLSEFGVSQEGIDRIAHTGMMLPTGKYLNLLEFHVRQTQFKINVRTYEDLRKYLVQCVRYDFERDKIGFFPDKRHSVRDYPTYSV